VLRWHITSPFLLAKRVILTYKPPNVPKDTEAPKLSTLVDLLHLPIIFIDVVTLGLQVPFDVLPKMQVLEQSRALVARTGNAVFRGHDQKFGVQATADSFDKTRF